MNRNEIKKFFIAYKNTICLDEEMTPIKILDLDQTTEISEFLIVRPCGTQQTVIPTDKIIPLKGRLKERDYQYIEARFHKEWRT